MLENKQESSQLIAENDEIILQQEEQKSCDAMKDSVEAYNSIDKPRKFYQRENSDEMIQCELFQSSLNSSNCSLLHPDSNMVLEENVTFSREEDETPFDIKMTSIAKVEATEQCYQNEQQSKLIDTSSQ